MDALGNPIDYVITGGEVHDVVPASGLLATLMTDIVIADKAYDSDALLDQIRAQGAQAVIPPRGNRQSLRDCDWYLYTVIGICIKNAIWSNAFSGNSNTIDACFLALKKPLSASWGLCVSCLP